MRPPHRLAPLLLGALLLVGCSADGTDSADLIQASSVGADSPELVRGEAAAGDAGAADQVGTPVDADRQVIMTASATVVVDDPATGADELVRLTEAVGGHVDRRSEFRPEASEPSARPAAWLTVRVPAAELTGLLEDLETLGEVRDLNQDTQDVTRTTRDLDARITALQTSVDRLLSIMADAETSEALIAAEQALSERQGDLEALQTERAFLSDQVAMSTLTVDLVARDDPRLEAEGFLGGLQTGWDALVSFASGLLVALGVILPWLPVAVVLLLLTLWFARRNRRRRPPAPEPAEPERAGVR
ncbi:MAG: DUF4349 domain-containing protein [Georgenia sp.]